MKLVYLWIEKFRNIERQGFYFTSEFDVEYDITDENRVLKIKESDKTSVHFGSKVTNITAIIGENGSGKTNILDLLGFRMSDRFKYTNYEAEYFIIYHIENNRFAIEGNNFEKLGFFHVPDRVSPPYSLVGVLGEDYQLSFENFLQKDGSDKLLTIISYRHNYNKRYWASTSFQMDSEPYYFSQRFAIRNENTGIYNKYRFLKDAVNIFKSSSSNNFQMGYDTHIIIKPRFPLREGLRLTLKYKDSNHFNVTDIFQPENMSSTQKKNYFISSFLENTAHDLYNEFAQNFKDDLHKIQAIVDRVPFRKDQPDKYLLKVLQVIGEEWDKIIMLNKSFFECLKEMYENLYKLPEEIFSNKQITIRIQDDENVEISNFLKYLDKIRLDGNNSVNSIFTIDIQHLSSGEEAFLTIFTSIYFAVTGVSGAENTSCLLLLDEPDSFMHPEWSRILINEVISLLENNDEGYKDYQIILTTHSPFIISDLPKENIIALRKDIATGKSLKEPLNQLPETFASNIHTLLSNEFFMKDTLGEFAKIKIESILKRLREIKLEQGYEQSEKDNIKKWIDLIGEPFIKAKLLHLYMEAFPQSKKELREERIKRLRAELLELEQTDQPK